MLAVEIFQIFRLPHSALKPLPSPASSLLPFIPLPLLSGRIHFDGSGLDVKCWVLAAGNHESLSLGRETDWQRFGTSPVDADRAYTASVFPGIATGYQPSASGRTSGKASQENSFGNNSSLELIACSHLTCLPE